ncbi:MAG: hypothetical protein R3D71_08010 [Rickettsiales bacterium]
MFLIKIGQKLILPLMIIVTILLILILKLGFIFFLIAMLPSIAAYFMDNERDRITFRTIFGCNLAATLPTITPMFIEGMKLKNYDVSSVIASPGVWLFIYAASAIGWLMIHFGGQIARSILEIQYKLRTAYLENYQERILKEWGDEVRQIPPKKIEQKK